MRLSAHQPAYLPWPGLLHKIASCDLFLTLDNVQFEKNSFSNRNRIRTREGAQWLTVPVRTNGHTSSTVGELLLDSDRRWQRKHPAAIAMNYGRAPHFERYEPAIRGLYEGALYGEQYERLNQVAMRSTAFMVQKFEIPTPWYLACELAPEGTGWRMILDLCRKTGANEFLFGAQGRDYLTDEGRAAFKAAGVKPLFQRFTTPEYPQVFPGFIPDLSALDLLLNVGGTEGRRLILDGGRVEE